MEFQYYNKTTTKKILILQLNINIILIQKMKVKMKMNLLLMMMMMMIMLKLLKQKFFLFKKKYGEHIQLSKTVGLKFSDGKNVKVNDKKQTSQIGYGNIVHHMERMAIKSSAKDHFDMDKNVDASDDEEDEKFDEQSSSSSFLNQLYNKKEEKEKKVDKVKNQSKSSSSYSLIKSKERKMLNETEIKNVIKNLSNIVSFDKIKNEKDLELLKNEISKFTSLIDAKSGMIKIGSNEFKLINSENLNKMEKNQKINLFGSIHTFLNVQIDDFDSVLNLIKKDLSQLKTTTTKQIEKKICSY